MRKAALLLVVLGLAVAVQAASYGTVDATMNSDWGRSVVVGISTEVSQVYCGAYSMNFSNPSIAVNYLWGNNTFNVFCADPFQHSVDGTFNIQDLQDAPTGAGHNGMGLVKAAQIATLLNNSLGLPGNLGAVTPSVLSANQDAALALAIWEVVAETGTNGYDATGGAFKQTSGPASVGAAANTLLSAFTGVDFSTVNTKPYYALVRPNADGQDFTMAIGVKAPPVPEPLTLASAFLAISSLGMYIHRRVR